MTENEGLTNSLRTFFPAHMLFMPTHVQEPGDDLKRVEGRVRLRARSLFQAANNSCLLQRRQRLRDVDDGLGGLLRSVGHAHSARELRARAWPLALGAERSIPVRDRTGISRSSQLAVNTASCAEESGPWAWSSRNTSAASFTRLSTSSCASKPNSSGQDQNGRGTRRRRKRLKWVRGCVGR